MMDAIGRLGRGAARASRSTILCVVGVLGGLGLAAFVRGSWADSTPLMPASAQSGPVCHLYEMPGEGKQVRCAKLLPYSMEQVWAAVTDYDNYGDICPYVRAGEVTHDPDGVCHLEANAESSLTGRIPFGADVRHEQLLDRY